MDIQIAQILKSLRKQSGLTAQQVAQILNQKGFNISFKTIYGYEKGIAMPNADMFLELCKIYNCSNPLEYCDYLFDDGHGNLTYLETRSPYDNFKSKFEQLTLKDLSIVESLIDTLISKKKQ